MAGSTGYDDGVRGRFEDESFSEKTKNDLKIINFC